MKTVDFKTSEAAAIDSGAMEADTISKHGRSSKSQMSRGNFLRHFVIVALYCGIILSIAMSGCNKDKDDKEEDKLAPVGTIAPPEWLIGRWVAPSTFGTDFYRVTSDSISIFGYSLNLIADLADVYAQIVGGTVKMKEIKKTNTEYEVGTITTPSSGSGTINPYYSFKKGDGTYVEASKYDSQNKKWPEFKRYNKVTQ